VLVTLLTAAAGGFLLAVVIITNHLGWTGAAAILAVILTAIHGISPASDSNGSTHTPSSTSSPVSAPAKPVTTDRCESSSARPLLPVLVSNEGPQVQMAELGAAVAGDNADPRKAQEYLDLYGHLDPVHVPQGIRCTFSAPGTKTREPSTWSTGLIKRVTPPERLSAARSSRTWAAVSTWKSSNGAIPAPSA
jgi:hypothetical protein